MALQRTKLADVSFVASSVAAIYTNPAAARTYIRGLLFHNTASAAEEVRVYVVPASGTAGDSNRIFDLSLAPKETIVIEIPMSIVLTAAGESIQAATTTAAKVTCVPLGDIDQ